MKRLSYFAFVPLFACYGGERAQTGVCPEGETCSAKTPEGLQFIGNTLADELLLSGPAPTAVGGTQDVALQYDRGDGVLIALDLPYTTDDDGGLGVAVDHSSGSVVTMRGTGSTSNFLRILDAEDGTLFDRRLLTGAPIDAIELIPISFDFPPVGANLAWLPGEQRIGIALSSQGVRVVDTSMQLALAGADRVAWDTLHIANATVGTSTATVTAGGQAPFNLDVVVVDHADAVAAMDPPATVPPTGDQTVCFAATNQGRYVVGLSWTFIIAGITYEGNGNCATVTTNNATGTITVQAIVDGLTTTVYLAVSTSAHDGSKPHRPAFRPTAGDRAAM